MTQDDSEQERPRPEPERADPSQVEADADDFEALGRADVTSDPATISAAYKRLGIDAEGLMRGFKRAAGLSAGDLKSLGEGFRVPAAAKPVSTAAQWLNNSPRPIEIPPVPVFDFSDAPPQRTAEATEKMLDVLQDVHTVTADLVRLTNANLQLTEAQQASARRTERFTQWMTWASLAVAVASFGVAVGAIFT